MRRWMWALLLGFVLALGTPVWWGVVGAAAGARDLMRPIAYPRLDSPIEAVIASHGRATDDPAIEVWFEEGCDRTYAMGTLLHMHYRANVSGLARVWRYPDHEIYVQDWLVAGVTYEINGPVTGPPGRWWIFGELLDSGATATCYYTTTPPVATPSPTGPTPAPTEPTSTPSTGTPSPPPTPTDAGTPVTTSTETLTPSPTATASPAWTDTPSASPTATAPGAPDPSPSTTPEPGSTTGPPPTATAAPGTPPPVQRISVWLPLVLVQSTR